MSNHTNDPFDFSAGLVFNILFLITPGLRLVGGIWMVSRIRKHRLLKGLRTSKALNGLATAFCVLALAEIFGDLGAAFFPFLLIAAGVVAYLLVSKKTEERVADMKACMSGAPAVSFDYVERSLGINEVQLKRYFKLMRQKNMLPATAYLDLNRRVIVLSPEGRGDVHEAEQPREERPHEERPREEASRENPADFETDSYTKILRQICHLNDEIADPVVSEKIDHIEATTANIFHLVKQDPERVKDIQSFLEYYLPTMLRLLNSYAKLEKQSASGENITSARHRIEGVMDKLVEGFDNELDRLFKREAIDITSDVNVLEKMMRMEGLTGK